MPGVYIHIPFCRQICLYCDFYRSASLALKGEVLGAIDRELDARSGYLPVGSVRTLYFGGGTPSVCDPQEIGVLTEQVRRIWKVGKFEEATLEANPDDLTPQYLAEIRAAGVDRLSIGVQSFDDGHLSRMNRRHTADQAVRAVEDAQAAGFGNITIDLIYGLPWMTPAEWDANLWQAVSLGVQHISAYHLAIEPGTIFAKRGLAPAGERTSRLHYDMLRRRLADAGFEHYEISNFARPGFKAVHNSLYWSGEHYLGAGPSAHSYNGMTRQWNPAGNKQYLEGAGPQSERLTETDRFNEMIMTRLRTADGLPVDEVENLFSARHAQQIKAKAEPYIERGVMTCTPNGRLAIDPEYFLVSDSVISSFFE